MFQIKDFKSITASMINYWSSVQRRVTDFNVGSVARTMIEAVGIEIDELYQQMLHGLLEAIPVSTYASFGFEALEPIAASGYVRFGRDTGMAQSVFIPARTAVQYVEAGLTYETTAEALLPAHQPWVDVLVRCTAKGSVGNCPPAVINSIRLALPGIDYCYNPVGLDNGADQETEEARKLRFRDWVSTLARTTIAGVLEGVGTAQILGPDGSVQERVEKRRLYEPWESDPDYPFGACEIYVHSGSGGASAALVAEAQRNVNGYYTPNGRPVHGWKAAGVRAWVFAAKRNPVNITGMVWLAPDVVSKTETMGAAGQAIRDYIGELDIDAPVVIAEVVARVMAVPYISNFRVLAPLSDVIPSSRGTIMTAGDVNLSLGA